MSDYQELIEENERLDDRVRDLEADLIAAEDVLRELKENGRGDIEDPHYRHWAGATIGAYFSGKAAE